VTEPADNAPKGLRNEAVTELTDPGTMVDWTIITPADAAERFPQGAIGHGVRLPLNEEGEECPWPWHPQQLVGAPLGQYHCRYCGAMVLAGLPHIDYRDEEAP
jgi:hypothetical protein